MRETSDGDDGDRTAIEALRGAYCRRLDDGDLSGWLDLFTDDAVVEYASREGVVEGRGELRSLADGWLFGDGRTRVHTVSNPLVEVDGDTASGRWYYRAVTVADDGSALVEQGRYDEGYRRVAGDWRIAVLTTTVTYESRRPPGWADVRPHR